MNCSSPLWAPTELSYFTLTASVIISVVSVVGNILIIAAVFKNASMRTPFNYYLINLALSDIITGAAIMPLSAVNHYQEINCVKYQSVKVALRLTFCVAAIASLLGLIAMSLERYFGITCTLKYRKYNDSKRCLIISLLIWLVAFTLAFVYFAVGFIRFLMIYACVGIGTGLVVLIFTYVRVYLFLRKRVAEMSRLHEGSPTQVELQTMKALAVEKKVTRTLMFMLAAYTITYVTATVMIFVLFFCTQCSDVLINVLRDVQFVLISSNSCVNPIICVTRLTSFSKAVKQLVCKKPTTRHE